jgi:hypothetical protein
MENNKNYVSLMIREYLWNSGDADEMIDAFYHFAEDDDVDFDDYYYIIELIDNKVPTQLIQEFDSYGDERENYIDSYEKKIEEYLELSN